MQITVDEKTLALLGTALTTLLGAVWYVSRAAKRIDSIDAIELRMKTMEGLVSLWVERCARMWKFLGFSEQRLQAQRSSETSSPGTPPPPMPDPPPRPPRFHRLIGPNDPFASAETAAASEPLAEDPPRRIDPYGGRETSPGPLLSPAPRMSPFRPSPPIAIRPVPREDPPELPTRPDAPNARWRHREDDDDDESGV